MKWIALAIFTFIAGYTLITLHYRKPGRAYQPYKDSRDRATVQRLQDAGYQRIAATVSSPADPQRSAANLGKPLATTQSTAGGLPAELNETLLEKPTLPESFSAVAAPTTATVLLPYSFQFTCTLPDKKNVFNDAQIYVKDRSLAIVATFENISGDLLARTSESTVRITLPGGTLQSGEYQVTLIGAHSSSQWTLQVH